MTYSSTFTSRYAAKFIEPIAENLCLLVEARQTYALSLVAGGLTLPDFEYVYRSRQGRVFTEYPVLMLDTARTAAPTSDDASHIEEAHEFNFELAVMAEDADTTTLKTYRYVAAVDSIWRSATSEELIDGMNPDAPARPTVGGAEIISISHEYSPTGKVAGVDSQYLRTVGITLTLTLKEL